MIEENNLNIRAKRHDMIMQSREYEKFYDNFYKTIGNNFTKTILAGYIKLRYDFPRVLIADMIDVEDRAVSELLKGFNRKSKGTDAKITQLDELLLTDENIEIFNKLTKKIESIQNEIIKTNYTRLERLKCQRIYYNKR